MVPPERPSVCYLIIVEHGRVSRRSVLLVRAPADTESASPLCPRSVRLGGTIEYKAYQALLRDGADSQKCHTLCIRKGCATFASGSSQQLRL
jgi:hypothetical protein